MLLERAKGITNYQLFINDIFVAIEESGVREDLFGGKEEKRKSRENAFFSTDDDEDMRIII